MHGPSSDLIWRVLVRLLAGLVFLFTVGAASAEPAEVIRVVDGDTLEVEIAGQVETVRLIGVDTPETVHPQKPVEHFGKEASAFTKRMAGGKTVEFTLVLGVQSRWSASVVPEITLDTVNGRDTRPAA